MPSTFRTMPLRIPLVLFAALSVGSGSLRGQEKGVDEAAAHARYDAMVAALRAAESLRFEASYRWWTDETELGRATYSAELQKPNQFRLEAKHEKAERTSGVLIGDGEFAYTYWPDGKPRYTWEYEGDFAAEYEKTKFRSYMKKPAGPGRHSIGHMTGELGAGMSMTILDPSTFHGYTDSLQPYLDGVKSLGEREHEGAVLDAILVSFMDGQRTWELWISREDGLPRVLTQVVRVGHEIHFEEIWSKVEVDAEIPAERFQWSPPEDFVAWSMPPIEAGLLKPGTQAPDFQLASLGGEPVRLSDYRGKTVWMFKWRVG